MRSSALAVLLPAAVVACSVATGEPWSGSTSATTERSASMQVPVPVAAPERSMRGVVTLVDPAHPSPFSNACSREGDGGQPLPRMQYQPANGPVISNVEVVQVSWGSAVDPAIVSLFERWYPAIVVSPYVTFLGEYDTTTPNVPAGTRQHVGAGTYKKNPASSGAWTIAPALSATTIDDVQVGAEIIAQVAAGNLPPPSSDTAGHTNTLYAIDLPKGVNVTLKGMTSCERFCAYHSSAKDAQGREYYYAVHPDIGAGTGCAPSPQYGWRCGGSDDESIAAQVLHAHELDEAITDPATDDLAWVDPSCGEIGDMCQNQGPNPGMSTSVGTLSLGGATYYVQTEWSNQQNDCVVSGKIDCRTSADCAAAPGGARTPFCDATAHACRACVDSDCGGSTPVCESFGQLQGQCVSCSPWSGRGCGGGTPYCDTVTSACVACRTDRDCPSATPACTTSGPGRGACVAVLPTPDAGPDGASPDPAGGGDSGPDASGAGPAGDGAVGDAAMGGGDTDGAAARGGGAGGGGCSVSARASESSSPAVGCLLAILAASRARRRARSTAGGLCAARGASAD